MATRGVLLNFLGLLAPIISLESEFGTVVLIGGMRYGRLTKERPKSFLISNAIIIAHVPKL